MHSQHPLSLPNPPIMTSLSPPLCTPNAFTFPSLPNIDFLSLSATQISNISHSIPQWIYYNHSPVTTQNLSFCNLTITYKHTAKNDSINVGVFLPTHNWNNRLQGIGGNGYTAGMTDLTMMGMITAVAEGYVAISTGGGHTSASPEEWAFLEDGGLDYDTIYDFGTLSLNDVALIGKSLAASVYGSEPRFSYWTGCSQGGRQGLQLAQLYPHAFDGIAASAPAINWPQISLGGYWAQFVMGRTGYPVPCEVEAITAAAVGVCDGVDGVVDGVVERPGECVFDPFGMVGTEIRCGDIGVRRVSEGAARVVDAAWTGARDEQGRFLWFGVLPGTRLTGWNAPADTVCDGDGCVAASAELYESWVRVFVERDLNFTLKGISHQEYGDLFHKSVQQWNLVFGSNNPDLSKFREAGGKMLSYHGLMDEVIPSNGTRSYYDAVTVRDSNVRDFYRHYEAPMMGHCYGQKGGYPSTMFNSLVAWVEDGTVPESLPVRYTPGNGKIYDRILCPYPQRVEYRGGDGTAAESFYCAE